MKFRELTWSLSCRPAPPGTWLLRWKSGSLASRCVQPKPNFQASPGDQILKLVDHYLSRSYGERDICLLKHRGQRGDIEALGKCATVGFLHFILDFCKGFGYAKTFSVFQIQHETDRCASRWPVKTFEIFTIFNTKHTETIFKSKKLAEGATHEICKALSRKTIWQ